MNADIKCREKFKNIMMCPIRLNFSLIRPLCNLSIGSPSQVVEVTFRVVAEHIGTRDLV
jgi:hypothetical protein